MPFRVEALRGAEGFETVEKHILRLDAGPAPLQAVHLIVWNEVYLGA